VHELARASCQSKWLSSRLDEDMVGEWECDKNRLEEGFAAMGLKKFEARKLKTRFEERASED
jgi:hypothetical protein